MTEPAIALIVLALNALVDSAEVFPVVIKSDLHACILHIFATILSTGACQEVLVGQSLPILRRFLQGLIKNPQHETPTQVRSALGRFLIILRNAQKREADTSLACEKNTLLASTILVTTCARILPPADPLIARFIEELADSLDSKTTTKVAGGLSRSLLLLPIAPNNTTITATENSVIAQILPRLLNFLTEDSDVEGLDETRMLIAQALTTFTLTLTSEQRIAALSIIVPTLLQRAALEGPAVYPDTNMRLLELAAKEQDAFRDMVGQMDAEQRGLVEEVLRSAPMQNGQMRAQGGAGATAVAPSIALKMDF
jgi:hypothetical protein